MKKALINLDVILDLLAKRNEDEAAVTLLDMCLNRKLKGYVSSQDIAALSDYLESSKNRNKIINTLLDAFSVLTANETTLRNALDSSLDKYEDALTVELSQKEGIDFLITNNVNNFKFSSTTVYSPKEAIEVIETG
jgi:excinuclease UvrABC ATPase subunit